MRIFYQGNRVTGCSLVTRFLVLRRQAPQRHGHPGSAISTRPISTLPEYSWAIRSTIANPSSRLGFFARIKRSGKLTGEMHRYVRFRRILSVDR